MLTNTQIKAEAKNLGFSLAGITSLQKPDHFEVYQKWLDDKHHGTMGYLARPDTLAKRMNPGLLMPEAKAILCLAYPYPNTSGNPVTAPNEMGLTAAYAWLPDYHVWLPQIVDKLMTRIEDIRGAKIDYRVFTDSAPVLERDLAWRAGLGWIGKNGCLIHPEYGSSFFLCEVMMDLELPIDPPMTQDRCGSCTRCIDACPTGCILLDRTIDAQRCISYLTIEYKEDIPHKLWGQMNGWLFGCDVCQSVCPWNHRVMRKENIIGIAYSNINPTQIDVVDALKLDKDAFTKRFSGFPQLRAKWEGYIRNAAIPAGNSHSEEYIPLLAGLLSSNQAAVVRLTVAWALGQIGGDEAIRVLQVQFHLENDDRVKAEIKLALDKCKKIP